MNPKVVLTVVLVLFLLSACGAEESSPEISPPEPEPSATLEPEPPTPTPEPEPTATEAGPGYEIISEVAYIEGGNRAQKVDIFLPTGDVQHPQTLLMYHGGSSERGEMYPAGLYFAERGYQVVVVGFRDWPKYKYPTSVEDVFCEAAWMAAHAEEFGLRIDQLVPYGFSFGATLGTSLVMEDEPEKFLAGCPFSWSEQIGFAGVVGFSGIYDYPKTVELSPSLAEYAEDYLSTSMAENPDIWSQASPATSVDGSEPPFYFIHGLNDSIPVGNVQYFAEVLMQAGVQVTADYPEDMIHGALIKSTSHLGLVEEWLLSLP